MDEPTRVEIYRARRGRETDAQVRERLVSEVPSPRTRTIRLATSIV